VVESTHRLAPHPMIARVKSLIPPAIVLLTLFLITLGLRYISVRLIADDVKKASYAECERVAELVYSQLELRMRALGQVSNHLIHSPSITETTFRGYTRQTMSETPGFAAIALADPDLRGMLIESDDPLWRADFDRMLATPTIAQAFEAARERAKTSRKFVITDPLSFNGRPGFAALEPVYREGELLGFIVGVFLYERLERTLIPELTSDFRVSLLQWNSQLNIPAYMRVVPDPFMGMKRVLDEPAETSRHLGSQRFVVRVEPAGWESTYRGAMPALFSSGSILTIGTILAVLLSVLLYRQQMVATRSQTEAQASQTKLVLTRERLERIKEELDLILNNVDESIILYDHDLGPLQANTSFRESFCPTPDMDLLDESADHHHKRMASLFQNEAQYWSLLNNLRENPERPFTDEIDLREPEENGTRTAYRRRYYQRRGTTVCGPDGSRRGYLIIFRDISSARAVERLKEDFLSSVTHDLRTPLASIKGFAETMLRDENMPEDTREEFTTIIFNEASRLQDMIEDLLDLRRMEEGQINLAPATFNLRNLVREVVQSSQPILFFPRDIEVKFEWHGDRGRLVRGDIGMVSRAIRNILSNAAKYSPRHSTVRVRGADRDDRVELEVLDEGPGIPPEDLPHLFEKFYRGSRHVRRTQGTGLGLAIVKHIIESHGGVVTATSLPSRGTCIRIVLPREIETGLAPVPEALASQHEAVSAAPEPTEAAAAPDHTAG
jgi:nitrogen-specific signal transduction histidine kinase/sensor domain CHASE-containing protein